MTPFLWFLAAVLFLGFVILLLALMRTASDADDEAEYYPALVDPEISKLIRSINLAEDAKVRGRFYDHELGLDFDRNERIRRQNVRCSRCGCLEANHDEGGCRVCSCSLPAHAIG